MAAVCGAESGLKRMDVPQVLERTEKWLAHSLESCYDRGLD
jgi:hypothetical protein